MTVNREDYIKVIYELGGHINQVSNKDIANTLKISAPSVSEMIKKLLQEGYIEYKLYQGVRLTEYGVREAKKIRRRHLLWEVFLVEKLGYSWDEIDEEAEKLEHVTSERLEECLDKYLNYPKICPHGSPIIENEINILNYRSLDLLSVGEGGIVRRLSDIKEPLRYADKVNLNIGDHIKVVSIESYNRMITFKKDEKEILIEKKIAKNIYVE